MKDWHELGIPYGGHIDRASIKEGDVIEVSDFPNKRYIVNLVDGDMILFDDRRNKKIRIDDSRLIGVIRGFPTDSELFSMTSFGPLKVDIPDEEREIGPIFTEDMIENYHGVNELSFTIDGVSLSSAVGGDKFWLVNGEWRWNKRWIIRPTLKFYSVNDYTSYFI